MKTKIFENARFTPKGDIEANWNKAVGFVPLDKEIIIYKPDENYSYARIKVGDGVTEVQDLPFIDKHLVNKDELKNEINSLPQVDYEQYDEAADDYIKNRPFYDNYKLIREGKEYLPGSYPSWNTISQYIDSNYSQSESIEYQCISTDPEPFPEDTIIYFNASRPNADGTDLEIYSDQTTLKENPNMIKWLYCYEGEYNPAGHPGGDSWEWRVIFEGWCVYTYTPLSTPAVTKVVVPEIAEGEFKQLDEKFIPDTIARTEEVNEKIDKVITATEEYIDEKISTIEVPTNYITTNTNQTNLSGTKEWTANGLVFNPEKGISIKEDTYNTGYLPTEFNWSEKYINLYYQKLDDYTGGGQDNHYYYNYLSTDKINLYHLGQLSADISYSTLTTGGSLEIAETRGGESIINYVKYGKDSITHKKKDWDDTDEKEIILTFPTESGTLATQEWVKDGVLEEVLNNELILGKDTITSEDQFYTIGTYTNTGITLEDNKFGGVVRTTTTYSRDYISFSHSNGTGDNETYGEPKSCKLTFPDGDGTIATQEYVGSKINGLPQESGWKITRYVLNHSFKTYNNANFYHEGFANFIEYESLTDSTKHKIVADIHITSEETITEPSDIGIKVLTTMQVGNKWESMPLYINNVFPEGFLDNTKYTNITVDKYQWITDITQDAIGRFNSNGSIGPVLYADRSNGFVPLVWGNGLELDTYNDGQPLIIGGKEIKVTYYDYYNIVNNKKS